MNTITKLSFDSIKTRKSRSIVVCVAILLTTILFVTIMSITFNVLGSYQLMLQLAGGSDLHAVISVDGYDISTEQLLSKIKEDNKVSEAYIMSEQGQYTIDDDTLKTHDRLILVNDNKILPHLFIDIIDGRFPSSENEIILNTKDFPDIKTGQKVNLNIHDINIQEPISFEYTVSGLFECDTNKFTSIGLYNEKIIIDKSYETIIFNFNNSINIAGKLDMLMENLAEFENINKTVNSNINRAFLEADLSTAITLPNVMLVIFTVSIVFFCAFLLIYNIYNIALTQDMFIYGLLNVIGMTFKQLKSFIRRQILILFVITIPIGLILGYIIGWRLLTPIFMSMSGQDISYKFSIWIFIISSLLTLFTVLFSAVRPLKRIKKLTPVETAVYNVSNVKINKKRYNEKTMNPFVLAFTSAIRNIKKMMITSISTALAIILFVFISTSSSLVKDITLSIIQNNDFILSVSTQISSDWGKAGLDSGYYMSDEFYDMVSKLDNIENIYSIRYKLLELEADKHIVDEAAEIIKDSEYMYKSLIDLSNGIINAIVVGVPDELCKQIMINETDFYKGKELYDGKHILVAGTSTNNTKNYKSLQLYEHGDVISLNNDYIAIYYDWDSNNFLRSIYGYNYIPPYRQLFILPMSVFEKEFTDSGIYTIMIDAKEGYESALRKNIDTLLEQDLDEFIMRLDYNAFYYYADYEHRINVKGRVDDLKDLDMRINALNITGYSLSAIIFLIGIINMINSSFTSVIMRRREYAMYEAVGMTGRQLKIMMYVEGFMGSAVAGIMTLFIGIPLMQLLLNNIIKTNITINFEIAFVMFLFILIISAVTSLIAFKKVSKAPLTERIRVE